MKYGAVGLVTLTSLAGFSRADLITPVSQDRHVDAAVGTQTQRFDAPDFGPFVQTANVSTVNGFANASLNSSIGPSTITGTVSAASQGFGGTSASAHSVLQLVFDLSGPATYTLSGHGTGSLASAGVSLNGPGVSVSHGLLGSDPPFSLNGHLDPGQYTFLMSA